MGLRMNSLFIICLLASFYACNGCTMEDVTIWQLPITLTIEDYHEGIILQRAISDIGGFNLLSYNELNGGPYVDVSIDNSAFVLRTNEAYRLFEENETEDSISLTFSFSCTNGQTLPSPLTVIININDNNNNAPLFKTSDTVASSDTTYEFTIAPPVPPGFLITDCVSDIIVRDIDLTTYRIDFSIEDNPYIAIEYDEAGSTVPKEFKAILRTTTFIRSIPEPIVLTISATDVDLTGDPPITTTTTVTIHGSSEFEMPQEPVFSQAFYVANYTDNHQITLEQPISLEQGYDEHVQFNLEGDYAADHFAITVNGNEVTLYVTSPLHAEALQLGQVYLVVTAVRDYTSGAASTVVVQLPEAVDLEFERPHYEGEIVDNTLQLTQLILSQGYQDTAVTVIVEDYTSFFTASVVGNLITLSMAPLEDNIIQEHNFINLRVTASTVSSSATAIVTLEIVKDDVATPVFGEPVYTGTYDSVVGLTIEPILLTQGYDDTVNISLSGEYDSYFELVQDGASSTLRVADEGLPSHILSEGHILLTVEAAKPRTVGASTVVSLTMPGARILQFEADSYKGSFIEQENILALDTIILNVGYDEYVNFSLSGDYSTSFTVSNVQNQVTINLPAQLPQEVISENNFLMLTLTAEGLNALPTTTAVLLEIIKDDFTTPVFSEPIYYGTYLGSRDIDMGNINLMQGYDNSVTFRIGGENSNYFDIVQNGNTATLIVESSIPDEVIYSEKVFVINIFADKPLTVGANAALAIKFPQDLTELAIMQFSNNSYTGSLEDNLLTMESIVLERGFAAGTQFLLSGDYASYFTHTITNNIVTLSMTSEVPADALENNKFIVLELEARRDRAVSTVTSIIIELVEEEIVIPVFEQAYYTGTYTEENNLQFEEVISLLHGYDDSVTFSLEGESASWFDVIYNANVATIVSTSIVPQEVLDNNHQLLFTVVAHKPSGINGRAVIAIALPKDILEQEVLRFGQSSYEGQLDGSELQVPIITLSNEITDNVLVSPLGIYATYFTLTRDSNTVRVELNNELPSEVISNNEFILIDITASKPDAVSGYTTLVLSLVKEPPIVTPVFEQAYYDGAILEGALVFEQTIQLIQGFDESVSFALNGDASEMFTLTQTGQNRFTLSIDEGGIERIANISHLVFSVVATKTGSVAGEAAIVIHNMDSSTARYLRFSQNHYRGSLEENILNVESISFLEGYSPDVALVLSGDYAHYFQFVEQEDTYILQLVSDIPAEDIEGINVFVFALEAHVDDTRTHATVIIELIKNNDTESGRLAFDETYYVTSYSAIDGVLADVNLRVVNGYDSSTVFVLEGGNSAWFAVQYTGSTVTISLVAPLPAELFIGNQPVIVVLTATNSNGNTASATVVVTLETVSACTISNVFSINARKTNSNIATATIVISLVDDFTDATILGFERTSYLGTIDNEVVSLDPIILNEGYTDAVVFTLQGELASHFSLQLQGSTVNILLQNAIPEQTLPANRIIILELRAAAPQAIPVTTTVVLEAERTVAVAELTFTEAYYIGQYSETEGLTFDTSISLEQGYDEDVEFALDGEHSQWFAINVDGNSVTLNLSGAIPPAVLVNNHQLVFGINARKTNSNIVTATIVISLVDNFTDATILGFERTSYLGTIDNEVVSLDPIILNEGYTDAVVFTLKGELASHFSLQLQGSTVNILLQNAIPEQTLPANRIIILELRAAAPQAIPVTTTVVLEAERTVAAAELTFTEAYYIGQYSETEGLTFDTNILLEQGYDEDVEFALDGEHSQWFAINVEGNSVTLNLSGAIPPAVLVNNHQLVFGINARKTNSNIATATIVISLVDNFTDATILGFERTSYLGTIDNEVVSLDPIILNEGYTDAVVFTLQGELASYFSLQLQGSTVNILLQNAIPEQTLPANRIIMLELRAAAPQTIPVSTTVVLEAERTVAAAELTFTEAYYIGQYSETEGLTFDTNISLEQGYDEDVEFALDGEHSQWFAINVEGNSVTLNLSGAIPPAVLVNNHQLVFGINARKTNSNIATATIVISLVDDFTDATILGFERTSYLGTIDNEVVSLDPIILNEGYTDAVVFTLQGELASYFSLQLQGSTVNILLQNAIPEQVLPANRIIMLEVRAAAPQAIPVTTTVVLEAERTVAEAELTFTEAYYIGQYSETEGLTFDTNISLEQGYDEDVEFALDGEHSQWFAINVEGNSVTLNLSGAIPPAVLVNNHQLVFGINARKTNSNIATATIVISLVDDFTDATILGFERTSYLGTIDNEVVSLDPIILNEGYTDAVVFTLQGELASYLSLQLQGSTVNILLQNAIPEQTLPANRIIMLELRAAAPQAIPVTTTVVLEAERTVAAAELTFTEAYYIGQYSETEGLTFDTNISLEQGYDEDVEFALDGEHSQWFSINVEGNSVTLNLSSAIPPAVLVNNHQLVFGINARKTNSNIATTTIVISLVDDFTDATILGFERTSYLGTIDNEVVSLDPIILNEGYTDAVVFTLQGELASYFSLQLQGSTVNILLQNAIPEQTLPANRIIMLELRAAAPQAIPVTTTVVLEAERTVAAAELTFTEAYYIGQYSETEGLTFDTNISLEQGYDEDVEFALDGEHSQWFAINVEGNSVTLNLSGAIPPAVIVNNHQLVFGINARKTNSNIATATIVISLVDDFTDATILGFERTSYLGTIDNEVVSLDPIILNEGYTDAVVFTLQGELASYFSLQLQGSTVNILLQNAIPEQTLPANRIIMLELRAAAPQAIPVTTTVVLEAERTVAAAELTFTEAYYIGQYSETEGLTFDTNISLEQGYDEDVEFALDGEHSQWFAINVDGNSVTLNLSGAIPPAVIVNNHQLVFGINARKTNSNIATATIVISLVDDFTDATILGFERTSYLGTIDNEVVSLDPIILNEGYTDAVVFTLQGELASYFSLQLQGSTVNILLQNAIPEQTLPANRIIMLELRAAAPQAIPVTTTVVLEAERTVAAAELTFTEAYYIGQYSETEGLTFDTNISLEQGYDEDVEFALDGEHSQWFAINVDGNSVTLNLSGAIPPAVIVNNHQLVFGINARKTNSNIATATIVISLVDDFTDATILGFERTSYLGTIDNEVVSLDPIILNEGYTDAVVFTLQGELASYFSLQLQGSTVNILLQNAIPDQALPANRIIMLELRAAAPQAIPVTTTIVLEAERTVAAVELTFTEAYYIGQYSETEGLTFDTNISLEQGYDEDVEFALDGEHSQWFAINVEGNSVTLNLSGAIPPAVIVNNHQLVFGINARKTNSNIATATIVISLVDDFTDATILGFERTSYLGTIDNEVVSLDPIILNEGYTDAVVFTLQGELASYFSLQLQGSTVNILLQNAIPDQALPANRIIMLELRAAAPQAIPVTTTIVLEAERTVAAVELTFTEAYYIGQYSETEGLTFDTNISLEQGYDEDVEFALDGEHSQWFAINVEGNSVTLNLSGAIPPAVLVNNHQLVFGINARKTNSNIATATIVISLVDDFTDATILGFERTSYLGTIANEVVTLDPIILNEGHTDAVVFTLQGELASYFSLQLQGSTVNILLQNAIPEQTLPANRIIMLELRAAAPQAIPVTTTVVLEAERTVAAAELTFTEAYYIGQYSETEGLTFDTNISLEQGYDEDVEFALDGEHSQWFSINVEGNSVTLNLSSAIPPAVLVNNHQLAFGINARKTNSNIATATIVISLVDDFTDATILGFERTSYLGTIDNEVVTLDPIILNEGYTDAVVFTLQGELASYFSLQLQGSTVNILLLNAIPEQTLPANRIIILELRAAAPQAIPVTTTVVLEAERTVAVAELTFTEAYYIGQYSETEGLTFDTSISLEQGYDEDVEFALDGEHSQWFAINVDGNSVTLNLSGAIPPAVLVNNHQLVFGINARKTNSNIATATIVISLVDDFTDATILGFERTSYLGTIANEVVTLDPIILNEGHTDAVVFTLQGELASYFSLQLQGSTVNILLQNAIPEQTLPANRIIMLELRAAAPQAIPVTTTVVLEAERTVAAAELTFTEAYYIGQYSETEGLTFDTNISLEQGYDEDVEFALDGEHSQWFSINVEGNSVTLNLSSAIPPAVLVNNHQLAFGINARKTNSNIATATIVISLVDDFTDATILGFERTSYLGTIDNEVVTLDPIILNEGYTDAVVFTLQGELASYFSLQLQGSTVNILLLNAIPEQTLPANRIIILELRAAAPQAIPVTTTVVLEAERTVAVAELTFTEAYYIGQYSETEGLTFDTSISLEQGYDEDVEFALDGEHSQWFAINVDGNSVTLNLSGAIPPAVLVNNHQLVFGINARKTNSNIATSTIVISLVDDFTDATILGFERTSYLGTIDNEVVTLDPIILNEGYTDAVVFTLQGELASYFSLQLQGSTVNILLQNAIPEQTLPANRIIILELRAAAPQAIPVTTTVVLEAERTVAVAELTFTEAYYIGQYSETEGLTFDTSISLEQGYDEDVEFALDGEHSQWFAINVDGNSVTLNLSGAIPPAVLVNNHQLVFGINARKTNSNIATATIVISLVDDLTDATILGFERTSYLGTIDNEVVSLDPIILNEGYTDAVVFTLQGDLASYFSLQLQGSTVNILLQNAIPEQALPANRIIMLEVRAAAPQAIPVTTTVVLEAERTVAAAELTFTEAYYIGQYSETEGLTFDTNISLEQGYDEDVEFALDGNLFVQYFAIFVQGNSVTLVEHEPIPPALLVDIRKFVMIVRAIKPGGNSANTVVIISVIDDSGPGTTEIFDKVLYEGTFNLNVVQHEPITITGFTGSDVEILGVYRDLFSATVSDGTVVIGASGTLSLPEQVTHVALELRAGSASAVLVLDVTQSETPELPTVTFGSPTYVLRADMAQTGLVGQVRATASNGENIAYSLATDDAHLQERVSINSEGEIHLSAPATTGVYSFQIIATSIITQVQATATVQLTIEAAAICGDDHALPPLIILDRDEEEPHRNLVVLDSVAQAGCQFRLTNRWPIDQDWLYVDENGLHARSIDREDPRIAFMALSQVQIELVLECASDAQNRVKRSTNTNSRLDWLGPYEYGSNKWILTDTILYNSRRSFVNLIVNDINDNYPIFVEKENEPIICGYPIPDLEEVVLPRALAELKATDADVGENAALSFWSSEDVLAVAPSTGSVHVRDGAQLTHDQLLTVSATDLNRSPEGLTGSIQLLVKLVDTSHIAVVTVRNAFLDQEETIMGNLSYAVGYEVKALSSAVISDDTADSENVRNKRQVTSEGASLQLYVYGLIDREPVAVDQLTSDITENALAGVDVTSTVSLEDYLEGREIYAGRDTALLVSTIVLSVLLFILIVAIALWFFIRWRKARTYEQFSDANSLASRNEPLEPPTKVDTLNKPRLNIDELKRSERRLQEMLDAPIDEVTPKAQTSTVNPEEVFDTILNMAPPDTTLPIVIQSIDKLKDDANSGDEDEYGERSNKSRRKSVVTFNENVEKIIHVEDIPDDNSSDVEIFKF